MADGNFNAAARCLEPIGAKNRRVWKTLIRCYFAAHRFDDVVSSYKIMPPQLKNDVECRHMFVTAAANLRRSEAVKDVIDDLLQDARRDDAVRLLSSVYPLVESLGADTHRAVVERIVASKFNLVRDHFDSVLQCAHDLRDKGWKTEAFELETALRREARNLKASMKLTILDAQVHFLSRRYDLQLAAVNAVLSAQTLGPVALRDVNAPFSCENLTASQVERSQEEGPLVSILMPAYNSAATIGYALESLRHQTYRNIEVIVVDDGSSDGTAQIVSRLSSVDPRFHLIGCDRNQGAFVARNVALAAARGVYVTNQDADDWAHPQKIEAAVAELQGDPSIVGTWVEHVRCSREHGFRALSGYFRPDASSLMFRRDPVMTNIGWYDSVRAAGDGEFHLRVERAFGRRSIRQIGKLLSFVNWSETSLSGGGAFHIDSSLGIFSPSRSAYRRSFGLWHETASRLYMPFPIEQQRPFPAPESLLPPPPEGST